MLDMRINEMARNERTSFFDTKWNFPNLKLAKCINSSLENLFVDIGDRAGQLLFYK